MKRREGWNGWSGGMLSVNNQRRAVVPMADCSPMTQRTNAIGSGAYCLDMNTKEKLIL